MVVKMPFRDWQGPDIANPERTAGQKTSILRMCWNLLCLFAVTVFKKI